ncbi:hypothetical protein PFFVO_02726 [Plasmodium falciparum Vietnam Oak-Knoll (FVO)]|uniref:ADP/ATP carrier protein n=1 Tax=Plasmodium falciparum Vietnam Oak-Knoll (FVO) TaxID=1036723 RepID=A0A024V7R1_PLAFA|nr:hypothetical protein PFFVO_02726 [Plasmodium falciparum Vietnam Oak-Knoll (FVO)]
MEIYYLKKKKKIKYKELFITTFLTHGGSNIISKLIISPLERIVLIKQIQPILFKNVLIEPSYTYRNIINSIRTNQGYTSFWWGYNASICNFLSFSFLRLLFHDQIKYNLSIENRKNYFMTNFSLLYFSSCLAASIAYPFDTVRNYMSLNHEIIKDKKKYARSVFLFIYDQIVRGKIRNLYCGYSLCLLNFIPYLLITSKLNEVFTKYFIDDNFEKNNYISHDASKRNNIKEEYNKLFKKTTNFFSYIALGVITGYVAQMVTYPLETYRRKYQYHVMYEQKFPNTLMHKRYLKNNTTTQHQHIFKKVCNLYRGFTLHSFKLIPEYFIFSCFFYYVKNNIPI